MTTSARRIPLWIKIAYTAFVAVLIPIYLKRYGPTNFLYFCDVAAILTVIAIWLENALLLSTALIGIFIPQMLWVADFFVELARFLDVPLPQLAGLTGYMFRPPWFLRFLSFFHFWLPFLLMYLVWRVGYDKRALVTCIVGSWVLVTICYACMPEPSPYKDPITGIERNPDIPVNINYVYGLEGDQRAQTMMNPDQYFALYLMTLVLGIYLPTHLLCCWLMPRARRSDAPLAA